MAAVLPPLAPRRHRPGRLRQHLLVAAAALFAIAAALLMVATVRSGSRALQLRLAQVTNLAALPWGDGSAASSAAAAAAAAAAAGKEDELGEAWPDANGSSSSSSGGGSGATSSGDSGSGSSASGASSDSSSPIDEPEPAGMSGQSPEPADLSLDPLAAGSSSSSDAGSLDAIPLPAAPAVAPVQQAAPAPQAAAAAADEPAACSQGLGVPKVALLSLTTRRLAHEKLWRLWLWDAAQLLPRQALPGVQAELCSGDAAAAGAAWDRIRRLCAGRPAEVVAAGVTTQLPPQHLFSIYVHAPPDYQGLEYQPLFVGRVIPARLRTWWGDISILDAERALLRQALADPLNAKFALISDADIPLYDPLTFYQQLLAEPLSRVRTCSEGYNGMNNDRWRDEMTTERMKAHHWRKSNQFFALTREHAELVVADTEAYDSFRSKCGGWYPHIRRWQTCVPDEHYIPTLLAALGREQEGYCGGWGLAFTDWSGGGNHPRSFKPKEVTTALFKRMRWYCQNATEAAEDSQHMFVPLEPLLTASSAQEACQRLQEAAAGPASSNTSSSDSSSDSSSSGSRPPSYDRPLDGKCPLTARKFPSFTALRVRQLFATSCPGGAPVLAESKAAQLFSVERDPQVTLLRGKACSADVQRQVLLRGAGGAAARARRRLLCAASGWLPFGRLEAACD